MKKNGPLAACDPRGYGAGAEPYEELDAEYPGKKGIGTPSALGTAPITELTTNTGIREAPTDEEDGRIAAMEDESFLV